jgi:hypothetical protein
MCVVLLGTWMVGGQHSDHTIHQTMDGPLFDRQFIKM